MVLGLHQVGDAALARLRVDADDRLVVTADVLRVDWQVRDVPGGGPRARLRVHPLLDRVLVGAGERRVDELADVRVTRVHRQLVALLDDRARLVELAQVEPGVDALREEVQRQRDQVDVARSLAVAEEAALDPLGTRHETELRGRHRRPAVVVRVNGEDRAVPPGEVAGEPLHAVRVDVRRERLDGRRQVDDHLLVRRRPPLLGDGLADLERVVELRVVEALRRVLEDDLRVRLRCQRLAELGAPHGELGDPVAIEPEDDAALRLRRRVVEVDDRPARCPRSPRTCARSAPVGPA